MEITILRLTEIPTNRLVHAISKVSELTFAEARSLLFAVGYREPQTFTVTNEDKDYIEIIKKHTVYEINTHI